MCGLAIDVSNSQSSFAFHELVLFGVVAEAHDSATRVSFSVYGATYP